MDDKTRRSFRTFVVAEPRWWNIRDVADLAARVNAADVLDPDDVKLLVDVYGRTFRETIVRVYGDAVQPLRQAIVLKLTASAGLAQLCFLELVRRAGGKPRFMPVIDENEVRTQVRNLIDDDFAVRTRAAAYLKGLGEVGLGYVAKERRRLEEPGGNVELPRRLGDIAAEVLQGVSVSASARDSLAASWEGAWLLKTIDQEQFGVGEARLVAQLSARSKDAVGRDNLVYLVRILRRRHLAAYIAQSGVSRELDLAMEYLEAE